MVHGDGWMDGWMDSQELLHVEYGTYSTAALLYGLNESTKLFAVSLRRYSIVAETLFASLLVVEDRSYHNSSSGFLLRFLPFCFQVHGER